MPKDPNKLILNIPHIPYGDPSLIGPDEWDRLKAEFPEQYKIAQKQIKAHAEAHPAPKADAAETPKPVVAAPATDAAKGEGK